MTHPFVRACLVAVAALAAAVAPAEVKILSLSGVVRVSAGGDVYSAASEGQPLAPGMLVVTGENGRVAIQVHQGNVVRLRGNAKLQIATTEPQLSRFKLLAGRLKGMFNGLTGGDKFQLEFGATGAIASVKGTTFTAEESPDGLVLHTLYGDIDLNFKGNVEDILQGCGATLDRTDGKLVIRRLTDQEIADAGLDQNKGARDDLNWFHASVSDAAAQDAALVTQIREEDFAVGRTLTDVHGNLARVDQRLMRPTPTQIEFLNLVKRDSYTYKNGRFSYAGGSGPRFDYLDEKLTFNMALPDNVMDWPGFLMNTSGFDVVRQDIVLANGKPSDTTRDVISKTSYPSTANSSDEIYINGRPWVDDTTVPNTNTDGSNSGDLWATSVITGHYTDGAQEVVNLYLEGYAIDQNGKILNLGDFTNTTIQDPISFAKTIGIEGIVSARDSNGNSVFGSHGNIDLVFIPDIFIAIAEKYAPAFATSGFSGN